MRVRLVIYILALTMIVFLLTVGGIWGGKAKPEKAAAGCYVGDGVPDYLISKASQVMRQGILSPHDEILDYTWQEVQHMTRIPRMNANDYQTNRGLHFTLTDLQEDEWTRYVDYNYWSFLGWRYDPPPSYALSAGHRRAGYSAIDVFRPLGSNVHSRAVISYHVTEPLYPDPERMYSMLSIEPDIPGQFDMRYSKYWYDIPDCFTESGDHGCGPVCGIDSLNRIHVVMKEGTSPEGIKRLGYARCYEISSDSIVSESPGFPERRIGKETFYTDQDWGVAVFGRSPLPTQTVATSKVSNRVALVWTDLAETLVDSTGANVFNCNDVFYVESSTGGNDWCDGNWPPTRINITHFWAEDYMRAYGDISAVYDFDDSLHVFFVAMFYDQVENEIDSSVAGIRHWSKATEMPFGDRTWCCNQLTHIGGYPAKPGKYNRLTCKVQCGVGIIDSTIDAGKYNKNYLYAQWTQFDKETESAYGYSQGDIYVTLSTDLGATWQTPINATNSAVYMCTTGFCAGDHWSSMAERVDTCIHQQWIYDRDAGSQGYPVDLDDGLATDNEVLYRCLPTSAIPILAQARIDWLPYGWTDPPVHIPVNGSETLYLIIENVGTATLNLVAITSTAGWMSIGSYPSSIPPGGLPILVELTISGQGSEEFYEGLVVIQSNDQVGNNIVHVPVNVVESDEYSGSEFEVISNPTFRLSVSNTGNLGDQNPYTGMYLYRDYTEPEANFIYDGSPAIGFIVPATAEPPAVQNDTLVGRYIFNEEYLVPATGLSVDTLPGLETIAAKSEFWPVRTQVPPEDQYWPWWRGQLQEHVMSSGDSTEKYNWNERYMCLLVLKLFHDAPPGWWASITTPTYAEATLLGMVLDIDCPSDSGAWNYPGYDQGRRMAWLEGYGAGVKENYRFALAQRDTCYEMADGNFKCWPDPARLPQPDQPYAMHLLKNDAFVYPQGGFRDDSLYKYMNTPGYSIYGDGIEEDYTIVNTGAVINTHSTTDTFEVRYAMLVADKFGEEMMDTLVNSIQCGNCDRDKVVGLTDVVYYINYLFKGGGEVWKYMADVDGNCEVGLSDVVYLIAYLFKGGTAPRCSCPALR
jgi:hypothetical protein